jgi:hemerythrin-like domain-containing protein
MQLTDILSSEHRVIQQVIAALDAAADKVRAGEDVRPAFFLDAARFIRDFADGFHHAKEEQGLFEAMARNGMPVDGGPIGVMLHEHVRGRELTAGLRDAAQRWADGDPGMSEAVIGFAGAYAELLTNHIYMEDNIVFPMAASAIPAEERDTLLDTFEHKDREQAERSSSKASYVDLARALCNEMGIDPEAAPKRDAMPSCHAH